MTQKISLFMGGSDTSAVRESDTVFLGQFSTEDSGEIVHFGKMPLLLAPNPTSIAADTAPDSQTQEMEHRNPCSLSRIICAERPNTVGRLSIRIQLWCY